MVLTFSLHEKRTSDRRNECLRYLSDCLKGLGLLVCAEFGVLWCPAEEWGRPATGRRRGSYGQWRQASLSLPIPQRPGMPIAWEALWISQDLGHWMTHSTTPSNKNPLKKPKNCLPVFWFVNISLDAWYRWKIHLWSSEPTLSVLPVRIKNLETVLTYTEFSSNVIILSVKERPLPCSAFKLNDCLLVQKSAPAKSRRYSTAHTAFTPAVGTGGPHYRILALTTSTETLIAEVHTALL